VPVVTKKQDTIPEKLQPYLSHKLVLNWGVNDKEAKGDCPWCGREDKFSIDIKKGIWKCLVCSVGSSKGGGNIYTFLNKLLQLSEDRTTTQDYKQLATERGIPEYLELVHWRVAKSIITDEWLVPGFNVESKVTNLYRRTRVPHPTKGYSWKLLPTKTLGHALHGLNLFDAMKPITNILEGPWDGMAFRSACSLVELVGNNYQATATPTSSLNLQHNVVALPGCETFFDHWTQLFFNSERINICFDNDHPRTHPKTGEVVEPAGWNAAKRLSGKLIKGGIDASKIYIKLWGENGDNHNPTLKSGFDFSDYIQGEQ
jgi:ribosomal protein L37AE/L43A